MTSDDTDWGKTIPIQIKSHMRTHPGEKPYQCRQTQHFLSIVVLKKHIRTYTRENLTSAGCMSSLSQLKVILINISGHTINHKMT